MRTALLFFLFFAETASPAPAPAVPATGAAPGFATDPVQSSQAQQPAAALKTKPHSPPPAAEAAPDSEKPPKENPSSLKPTEKAEVKKWKLNVSHTVNTSAAVGARAAFVNSLRGRYKRSEAFSLAAAGAHSLPLGVVSDNSNYGLTDISLSAPLPAPLPKGFLAEKWSASGGVSLPTSHKSRAADKLLSLFASANHVIKKGENHSWSGGHTLYAGLYKYRSGKSGYRHNPLFNSFHSLSYSGKYKNLSFSAQGRLYLSLTLKKRSAGAFRKRLRPRGGQGASLTLSYTHSDIGFFGQASSNIPFISPVLTGFSFLKLRSLSYTFGVRWEV